MRIANEIADFAAGISPAKEIALSEFRNHPRPASSAALVIEVIPMFDRKLFTSLATEHSVIDESSSRPVFPLPQIDGLPPVLLVFDHTDLTIAVAYEKQPIPGGPLVRASTRETTRRSGRHRAAPVADGSIRYLVAAIRLARSAEPSNRWRQQGDWLHAR